MDRCRTCCHYCVILNVQSWRLQKSKKKMAERTSPSSHVNHGFMSTPELVSKLEQTHHKLPLNVKQVQHLKSKIAEASEQKGVTVDEEMHQGLQQIMEHESGAILKAFQPDTFQHIRYKLHVYLFFPFAAKSFVEMVRYLFTMPDVKAFLSRRIYQDPLE